MVLPFGFVRSKGGSDISTAIPLGFVRSRTRFGHFRGSSLMFCPKQDQVRTFRRLLPWVLSEAGPGSDIFRTPRSVLVQKKRVLTQTNDSATKPGKIKSLLSKASYNELTAPNLFNCSVRCSKASWSWLSSASSIKVSNLSFWNF